MPPVTTTVTEEKESEDGEAECDPLTVLLALAFSTGDVVERTDGVVVTASEVVEMISEVLDGEFAEGGGTTDEVEGCGSAAGVLTGADDVS